jgi:ribosome biogenesis GTPase A
MWLAEYNKQKNMHAVAISSKNAGDVARIPDLCQKLAPHRDDNLKQLRMMIMGVPNVGKSTLMNALLKRRTAAVGDEPGITKDQQTFDISPRQSITDTPGLMWPKIQYESDGFMLAVGNAIGRNAVIDEEIATFLADILLARYPDCISKRYGFSLEGLDGVAVIEHIAQKRGFRLRGGKFDFEKASITLLQDYRDGKLGRISLETPKTRELMLKTSPQAALLVEDPPEEI